MTSNVNVISNSELFNIIPEIISINKFASLNLSPIPYLELHGNFLDLNDISIIDIYLVNLNDLYFLIYLGP